MKKSELKQLIKEVIMELQTQYGDETEVSVNLSKLGKGSEILTYVPVNYTHTDIEYTPGERPSMYSPGADDEFYFEVTYTAQDDITNSSGKLVFKKGEEIPEKSISEEDVKKIHNKIIKNYKERYY